jgi:hypothetical protein
MPGAWWCRDHSSPFVAELEDLLEGYNPEYVRSCQQHTPDVYAATLSNGEGGPPCMCSCMYCLTACADLMNRDSHLSPTSI